MRPDSASLRELSLASVRELVRDRQTFLFAALFPFFFLGLFVAIGALAPPEPGEPDIMRFMLPVVLFIALASVALLGTVLPLVKLREQRTLRLLGTTPVSRGTILLAQVPARLALAAVQFAVIIAVTAAQGYLDVRRMPALVGTAVLGLAMLGALGFLLSSRLSSVEAASSVLSLAIVVFMFAGGPMLPADQLPAGVRYVFEALPTTYLIDVLTHQMAGVEPRFPIWLSYLVIAGGTVVFGALAARLFRWDPSEPR